jgi:hypothetical protein
MVLGVGQGATNEAAPFKSIPPVCVAVLLKFGPPLGVFGVGHPVEPLSPMGRADGTSSQYVRPDRVAFRFQVSRYSIEPIESNRLSNLLAKDALRAMLADEPEECWPEVAVICRPSLLAGDGKGLAGERG